MPLLSASTKYHISAKLNTQAQPLLEPVNTNYDVVAAAPNVANQGARREVWWFQMNAEQRRVASFGAQPAGVGHFSRPAALSQAYVQQAHFACKALRSEKMAESTPAELVLTGSRYITKRISTRSLCLFFLGFHLLYDQQQKGDLYETTVNNDCIGKHTFAK